MSRNTQLSLCGILENCSDHQIILQLLQTATLLIHNLSKDEDKSYLVSSKFCSNLVSFPFDFTNDEVVDNYMSYIKGLAVNLNKNSLAKFLLTHNFALFSGAMMFFHYKDPLIRTASRTVILSILKSTSYLVNHDRINAYVLECEFCFGLVSRLWQIVVDLGKYYDKDEAHTEELIGEAVDLMFCINDIYQQEAQAICQRLVCGFLEKMIPGLVGSVCGEGKWLDCSLALMVLAKVIQVISVKSILDTLVGVLFAESVPRKVLELGRQAPPTSPSKDFIIDSNDLVPNSFAEKVLQKLNPDENFGGAFSATESLMSLFVLQSCICNPNISQSLLASLGLLSRTQAHSEILSDLHYPASNYNSNILESILSLLLSSKPGGFIGFSVSMKIIYELSCGSAPIIRSSHVKYLQEILLKFTIRLTSAYEDDGQRNFLIENFELEWLFIKNMSFSHSVPMPICKSCCLVADSSGISIRKLSSDRPESLQVKQIQEDVRVFFIVYKLLKVILQDDPNEYPLEVPDILGLKPGDCVDTSNYYIGNFAFSDLVKASLLPSKPSKSPSLPLSSHKPICISENEGFLLLLEPIPDLAPAAKVLEILQWKRLKVSTDISKCSLTLTVPRKVTPTLSLQLKSKSELVLLQARLVQRISFALSLEGEIIRSFLEDTSRKIIGSYSF